VEKRFRQFVTDTVNRFSLKDMSEQFSPPILD
jgi:hypothetical protein